MDDTTWAVNMSTENVSPDDLLDTLRHAQEISIEEYNERVLAPTAAEAIDTKEFNAFINSILLCSQAYGQTSVVLSNGPVSITVEVDYAQAE